MTLNAPPVPRGRAVSVTILAIVLLVVAGVSIAATAAYFELARPPATASGPGSVTLVDDYGRSVSVPVDPHRVVAFGPNLVDSLVRLGLRSDLVGVDCSATTYGGLLGDYSANQTEIWNLTPSMCVQAFPSLDTEELLNESPDLIVATSVVSQSGLDEFSVTYGVPVVWLVPASLDGIVSDVRLLATIFPSSTLASPLESALETTLAAASAAAANASAQPNATLPSVLLTYYVYPSAGYYTYGPGTFGDSLVVLAGGRNVAGGAGVPYPVLSGTDVLADNPAVIVYGTGPLGEPLSSYAQGPDWGSFNATKVPLDVTLFTEADPTMILVGLADLTNALQPVHG